MRVAFDLDGVLDKPAMRRLCMNLLGAGDEVFIITGCFSEAPWQTPERKREKLHRIGISFYEYPKIPYPGRAELHILEAVPETFDRDYRLADLGLRKGELCERLGIDIIFDDSSLYCDLIPKMAGGTTVVQVR